MNHRRAAAAAGATLLIGSSLGLAAAGPELIAAATWVQRAGGDPPGWLLGVFGQGIGLKGGAFYALLWAAFAGYLLLLFASPSLGRRRAWLLAGGLTSLFTLAPPLLSQDAFSYIAYARLGAEHGLNPYLDPPAAIAADPVFQFVGWPDAVSVYGPLFTVASYIIAPLSLSASLWLLKAVMALAVLGTAAITERLAAARGADPVLAMAVVAFNPLVLVHVVGGAHNDALMVLALTGACAFLATARPAASGGLFVAAGAIKLAAAFAAPFALVEAARQRRAGRLLAGAAVVAAGLLVGGVALFGSGLTESIALVGDNQGATSRYSLPATASRLTGFDLDLVRSAFLMVWAVTIVALLAWNWRGGDWLRAAAWAGLATLLATGWLLPWYLIWVLPLVVAARDRPLLLVTLALTGFQLISRVPL